jgi:hypothetical protein
MAWRIEDTVAHGEIDNTVEGHTTGRIWLEGRDEPLILSLNGDCWRDLAGTRLQFENPSPKSAPTTEALDMDQSGIIGDMTASKRNKVPTVSEEEFHHLYQNRQDIPHEWQNTLYLEWFSEINGRVVIETAKFHLIISPHEWEMDEDAEDAQKLANLNSMRDFMTQVIRRKNPEEHETDGAEQLDEFEWEERLKESDRLTDAYQEVLEKYMEDADSEQKEAFVMGWDGLLDALAERDEEEGDVENFLLEASDRVTDEFVHFNEGYLDSDEFDDESYEDGEDVEEEENHPLQAQAQELAMRAMDITERGSEPGTPSYILITNLLQVSGKLAGVLYGRESGYQPETGFILAVLKRCINWINEAVGACQQLLDVEQDADQKAALAHMRSSMFEIRDSIVEMRRELK